MNLEYEIAGKMMSVTPRLMNQIRSRVREEASGGLTFPQFRVMANIRRGLCHVGQIADHQGVSQPAISKMVEILAARGLIKRSNVAKDRRQTKLSVTPRGDKLFKIVRNGAQERLSHDLGGFSEGDLKRLDSAMDVIESLFLKLEQP